jgi:hypothetical protein
MVWPCASRPDGLVDRLGGPRHRAVDRAVHLRRGLAHPLGGGTGAALDPRDMGAEPLRRAADLVRLAAARGERGELAFQRPACSCAASPACLHRLGGGARLLLGLGQVAHQHADIDPRGGGGMSSACALRSSSAAFAGECRVTGRSGRTPRRRGSSAAPLPRRARPRFVGEPRRDDRQHALERLALAAHRPSRAGEALRFAPPVRPNSSQTRPIRISGALKVAIQPIHDCRLGPGQATLSA